jgi:hypothetical protein
VNLTEDAFSPLTGSIVPYGHASLLQDLLDKANIAFVESYRDSKGKVFAHYYEWEKVNTYYQHKLDAYYVKKGCS